jgi:sugar phosphate isomerase/epimerase
MNTPIALQLYSVREALAQNFEQTVEEVAAFGYHGVEVFGNFRTAQATKQLTDDLGLKVCGRHAAFDPLRANLAGEIEYALELGAPYLICAWSQANEEWNWGQIADELARMAAETEAKGLKFAYHNHGHELTESHHNQRVMDLILSQPKVYAEFDIAWLRAGGVDSAEYVKAYAAKAPLLHVKDVAWNGKDWDTVELGKGQVELAKTIAAAQPEWLIVEQDHSPDPMGSAERNLATLQGMLGR